MFEEFTKALKTCTACPSLCQSACPVFINDGNRSHSPWGLMQLLNAVRKKQLSFDETLASELYHCLECRACTEQCEHHIDVPGILVKARSQAVRQELAPKPITDFIDKFHRHNNPFSRDLVHKLQNIMPEKHFKQDSSVVYFASCTMIAKNPEVIKDTFSLFNKLNIDFVRLYTDPIHCCGYPLLCCGAEYEFIDIAEINYHALKKFKTIITACPVCAHTLKHTYAKYDFNIKNKIITINEFLEPYLKNAKLTLKKRLRTKTMFHDPCYLARYFDETNLARKLISNVSGHEPTNFERTHKQCQCCGQGSSYPLIEKDRANKITQTLLQECHEKNQNTLITQCPICIYKMRQNSKKIVIKDLMSYLNDCIEEVIK